MANLLAIESSAALCSVALKIGQKVTFREQEGERSHTQFMLSFIDELLHEKQCNVADLDAIVFSAGPGSFTGVRLATSVAKSLAYAGGIPVIPVSSLAVIAQGVARVTGSYSSCLVTTDARMGEVYVGEYSFKNGIAQPVRPEMILAIDALVFTDYQAHYLAGNAAGLLQNKPGIEHFELVSQAAHAQDLFFPAEDGLKTGETQAALEAEAIYLRDKTSWKNVEQQKQEKKRG